MKFKSTWSNRRDWSDEIKFNLIHIFHWASSHSEKMVVGLLLINDSRQLIYLLKDKKTKKSHHYVYLYGRRLRLHCDKGALDTEYLKHSFFYNGLAISEMDWNKQKVVTNITKIIN